MFEKFDFIKNVLSRFVSAPGVRESLFSESIFIRKNCLDFTRSSFLDFTRNFLLYLRALYANNFMKPNFPTLCICVG